MKIKHKGKVYPSPSPSSSLSSSSSTQAQPFISSPDALSVLKLLPAAILALASVLSTEDKEVLAYMITRSIKTTTTANPCSSFSQDSKRKSKKQPPSAAAGSRGGGGGAGHKPPVFDCGCFECYTCYWFRWDSSPNRELIHQAIEAFEDHLSSGEKPKRIGGRGKKKDRVGRRVADKPEDTSCLPEMPLAEEEGVSEVLNTDDTSVPLAAPEDHALTARDGCEEAKAEDNKDGDDLQGEELAAAVIIPDTAASSHKGLARKVLPDVLGLLNSRIWSLWSPTV